MKTQKKHTPPLAARSHAVEPDTGIKGKAKIAGGLADVLGDTYALIIKTHACHWNVVGPLFYSVHKLTEEQYADLFEAADVLAERIRALGQLAPTTMKSLAGHATIDPQKKDPSVRDMIEGLVESHEQLARRLRDLIEIASDGRDAVTEDLATQRAAFHEKAAWMLRAMITE